MDPSPVNPEQPSSVPPPPPPTEQPPTNIPPAQQPAASIPTTPPVPVTPSAAVPNENPLPTISGGASGPIVSGSFDAPPTSSMPPTPIAGGNGSQAPIIMQKKRRFKKPLILIAVLILLLGGGAAAYYFGYYTNPSVVLSQSLSNTGQGYSKVVDYFNQQSKAYKSGMTGTGSYKLKSSSFSTDGNLRFESDGNNSQTSFDVGAGVTRVSVEMRTIKSAGTNPDIYVKASGIKGLGSIGGPSVDSAVNQLDGKWIVVDHTLLDNIEAQASQAQKQSQKPPALPTRAEIMDEVKTFGQVNQQYVFTTDKNKAVTTVVKKYGIKTINGHKVYHYKMGFVKANVKAYITAQRDALKANSLGAWVQQNNYLSDLNDSYTSLEKSADSINSKDTFDLWSDINTRLVYKVRVSDQKNPATNYVDVGLDYKGGFSYPFFVSGQSDQDNTKGTFAMVATLNGQTNSVNFKMNVNSTGSNSGALTADLTAKPNSKPLNITAPAGAESLSQVLDQLGIGDLLNNLSQSASSLNSLSSPDAAPGANTPPAILN